MNLPISFYTALAVDALFEGGRMFTGATSAAYLLSQGVSLSQVALLKSIQAIIIVLGEVPTGIFADLRGHKNSLLLSLFCAIMGFICYFLGDSFAVFIIGEILVALSLCFWSGAYESFAIHTARLEGTPGLMDRFFHLNQMLNSAAVLSFGFLGGWVGTKGLGLPFLGAALSLLIAIPILLSMRDPHRRDQARSSVRDIREWTRRFKNVLAVARQPNLLPFFLAQIAVQFSIQPLLHYWQPLFQKIDVSVESSTLGTIFSLYCGTSMLFGALGWRLSKAEWFRSSACTSILFLLFGLLYTCTGLSKNIIIAVGIFCLAQGLLAVARTSLSVRFNESISSEGRAATLSSLSLVSRLGMILALLALAAVSSDQKQNTEQLIFMNFGVITTLMAFVTGVWMSRTTIKNCLLKVWAVRQTLIGISLFAFIIIIQISATISTANFYPFSSYRMFSRHWPKEVVMDNVRIESNNREYRSWDLLDIPFFQANQLMYMTYLDSAPRAVRNKVCRILSERAHNSSLKIVHTQTAFLEHPKYGLAAHEVKRDQVFACAL